MKSQAFEMKDGSVVNPVLGQGEFSESIRTEIEEMLSGGMANMGSEERVDFIINWLAVRAMSYGEVLAEIFGVPTTACTIFTPEGRDLLRIEIGEMTSITGPVIGAAEDMYHARVNPQ